MSQRYSYSSTNDITLSGIKDKGITPSKAGSLLVFTKDDKNYLTYDLADGDIVKCSRGIERNVGHSAINAFFRGHQAEYIANGFTEENYGKLIIAVLYENPKLTNMGTVLRTLTSYRHLEPYILQNVDVNPRIKGEITMYPKNIMKIIKKYDICISEDIDLMFRAMLIGVQHYTSFTPPNTKDFELLNKSLMYLDANYPSCMKTFIHYYFRNYAGFNSRYKGLVEEGYNYKKLLKYLFDFLPNCENVELSSGISDLYDYHSMMKQMKTRDDNTVKKFTKYPNHLLSVHYITIKNFKTFNKQYDEEDFEQAINHNYECKVNKEYSVVAPRSVNDVKYEGVELSHCVSSYIQRVIDGECHIMFLRDNEKPDKALVTLLITNNELIHAVGFSNRLLTKDERLALISYCKTTELKFNC